MLGNKQETLADAWVIEQFEGQTKLVKNKTAVEFRSASVSYSQLNRSANQVARALLARGIQAGDLVGIYFNRSIEMIIAILAVFKTGAAYLPLDPKYPEARNKKIIAAAQPKILLCDQWLNGVQKGSVLRLDWHAMASYSTRNLSTSFKETVAKSKALAYVLFTSGSSGRPKGVSITQANCSALLNWARHYFLPQAMRTVLFSTSICFDLSVFELFLPLITGNTVHLATQILELADPSLQPYFSGITLLNSVPSAVASLLSQKAIPQSVHTINCAGEVLTAALAKDLYRLTSVACLYNLYAPTEATTYVTCRRIAKEEALEALSDPVPIGTAITGSEVFVLDDTLAEVGVGERGEIFISGENLALGYFNEPELTARQFIQHPVTKQRLYATGDVGYWDEAGELRFVGRKDDQVKINGYRVELSEIECCLLEHPAVCQAVALLRRRGCIEVVVELSRPLERARSEDLRGELFLFLKERLPFYMLPQAFQVLETMPRLPNGKIDRQRLKEKKEFHEGFPFASLDPARFKVQPKRALQEGEIASAIETVWKRALGHDRFDAQASFFERGGHSLLLNKVQFDLEEALGTPLSTVLFFQYPTMAQLSKAIFRELQSAQRAEFSSERERFSLMDTKHEAVSREAVSREAVSRGAVFREVSRSRDFARDFGGAEGVAVVGMACRFPQASTLEAFWANLSAGRESIRPLSEAELAAAGVSADCLQDPRYVTVTAQPEEPLDWFDDSFFRFSEREISLLDPQQRLLLECAWEALEDAGLAGRDDLRIGVFASVGPTQVLGGGVEKEATAQSQPQQPAAEGGPAAFQVRLGQEKDYAATRIAYQLNLTGPAISVQTACSSSLVALHLAKQSILLGECEAAVVAAASVQWPPSLGYWFEPGWIASPDGHCRSFDAAARGTVFGSGAAALVILKSELAGAPTYRVPYALVVGSAINNDGCDKVSYTAPSVSGQLAVIRAAQADAKIRGEEVTLIEAHGSGTPLGDALEFAALAAAYGGGGDRFREACALGSVKSNLGHLDCAAGLAGLIKAVLCLQHRSVVPHLHFTEPNPDIDLAHSPFYIPRDCRPWESDGPRYAAVSSLGIGGTNAHVILREACALHSAQSQEKPEASGLSKKATASYYCLWISARSLDALTALCWRYLHFLSQPAVDLPSVCFTSQVGRAHSAFRRAVVAQSAEEMSQLLSESLNTRAWSKNRLILGSGGEADPFVEQEEWGYYSAHQLARVYVQGGDLSAALRFIWANGRDRHCVAAPTYPFQRRRIEFCSSLNREPLRAQLPLSTVPSPAFPERQRRTVLGQRMNLPFSSEIRFETVFSQDFPSYNRHHRLFGQTVVPGSSHIVLFLTALRSGFPQASFSLKEVYFKVPLRLEEQEQRKAQLILRGRKGVQEGLQAAGEIQLVSEVEPGRYTVHASADYEVSQTVSNLAQDSDLSGSLQQWLLWEREGGEALLAAKGFARRCPGASFYRDFWLPGEGTGASFRWLDTLWGTSKGVSFAKVLPPSDLDWASVEGAVFHPGLLEAGFQLLAACRLFSEGGHPVSGSGEAVSCCAEAEKGALNPLNWVEEASKVSSPAIDVPYHIDEIVCDTAGWGVNWQRGWAAVRMAQSRLQAGSVWADVVIATSEGSPCIKVRGFKVRKLFPSGAGGSEAAGEHSFVERGRSFAEVSLSSEGWHNGVSHGSGGFHGAEGATEQEAAPSFERTVKKILHDVLGGVGEESEMDFKKNFFDLGMDSLSAIEYRGRLQAVFRRVFPATIAFDYPSLAQATEYLRNLLGEAAPAEPLWGQKDEGSAELVREMLKLQQVLGKKKYDETH